MDGFEITFGAIAAVALFLALFIKTKKGARIMGAEDEM